jgi:predicted GNAT family acetyltransferase
MIKLEIRHNPEARRFEAFVDGELCRADYRMAGDVMHIVHSEVPYRLEGQGLAAQVVRAALDYARANGLKVVPACGYVRAYMRRHKESQDLLAEGSRP